MKGWRQLWERVWDHVAASALGQRVWARYEAAAPREQVAMKLLSAFVLVLLALLLVMPLHRFNSEATANYRQQLDTLAWMQANRGLVGAAAPATRRPGDSLLTLASQSAHAQGLSFKRYEPRGDNGLNLWLEKVPFNQVVVWLGNLEKQYGVVAREFSASRRDEEGLVDVKVVLEG